jgi:hypothetical protein
MARKKENDLGKGGESYGTIAKILKRPASAQSFTSNSTLSVLSHTPPPPDCIPSSLSTRNEVDINPSPSKRRKISSSTTTTVTEQSIDGYKPRGRRERMKERMAWKDRNSDQYDIKRVIAAGEYECLVDDNLSKRPPKNYTYLKLEKGEYTFKPWILEDKSVQSPPLDDNDPRLHPKLKEHEIRGTATWRLRFYYADIPHDKCLPMAGVIKESSIKDFFRGHKLTHINLKEEGFHQRPSIKLIMPDHLKAILVDDWENVTKNSLLVPIPSAHPVNAILADYLAAEKPHREAGSAQADILEEVVAGLKTYFDKCLGRILLYRSVLHTALKCSILTQCFQI